MAHFGAGELLITSMAADGTKAGYDLPLMRSINDRVSIPTIASGGVGNLFGEVDLKVAQHFSPVCFPLMHGGKLRVFRQLTSPLQ